MNIQRGSAVSLPGAALSFLMTAGKYSAESGFSDIGEGCHIELCKCHARHKNFADREKQQPIEFWNTLSRILNFKNGFEREVELVKSESAASGFDGAALATAYDEK